MKIILILTMCSLTTYECMTPFEWPVKFDSAYDCSMVGFKASADKLIEIGKEEVDLHKISITFECREINIT
tara:strand:- start:69 stop:281 length:213 start_codon:yes stop_codon:yes gene_type:complete